MGPVFFVYTPIIRKNREVPGMGRELYLPGEYHEKRKGRRRKAGKWICILLAILIACCLTGSIVRAKQMREKEESVQHLAGEVFRFHVLANSDSKEDQELKLKVRDAVLSYMKEELPDSESVEETKSWAKGHLTEITEKASEVIEEEGKSYPVHAEVTRCEFPDKTYGDLTFPAGRYDALRIEIGKAKGHNWWCVLYPNLCFVDSIHAVVPDEGKQELRDVLTDEEYEMVMDGGKMKLRVKWFFRP